MSLAEAGVHAAGGFQNRGLVWPLSCSGQTACDCTSCQRLNGVPVLSGVRGAVGSRYVAKNSCKAHVPFENYINLNLRQSYLWYCMSDLRSRRSQLRLTLFSQESPVDLWVRTHEPLANSRPSGRRRRLRIPRRWRSHSLDSFPGRSPPASGQKSSWSKRVFGVLDR